MCRAVPLFLYPLAPGSHNLTRLQDYCKSTSRAHTHKSRYKLYAVVNKDTHLLTVRPIVLYSFVEEIYCIRIRRDVCECVDVHEEGVRLGESS